MAEYWKPREDRRPRLPLSPTLDENRYQEGDDEVVGKVAGAEGRWLLRLVIAFARAARILGKPRAPSYP